MHRRNIQAPVALFLLSCGVLLSATIDHGTAGHVVTPAQRSALESPDFTIQSGRGRLILRGTTVSFDHESVLRHLVAEQFADYEAETVFHSGVLLPAGWETLTSRLVYVLAATRFAWADIRDSAITIRAVTDSSEMFAARLEFLRELAPQHVSVEADVIHVAERDSHESLCSRSFANLAGEPVAFRQSSAEIRSASFGSLDRLVGFAHDCRHYAIVITGHSDASGDETWNQQLSEARAQAVADYLSARGIDSSRLIVTGKGSSEPIADNATSTGRSLNRRIEFELQRLSL